MPFSRFQPHCPVLLSPDSATTSSETEHQKLPIQEITNSRWHMIASSSSLWQDRKHSLTINYSPIKNSDSGEFNDLTTWYAQDSNKPTTTKGICRHESGFVFHWRGAGWLRWVTTKWETVGVGMISSHLQSEGEMGANENEDDVVVLVTFVPKTMFSPQAVSIFLQTERLDEAREDNVVKGVVAALKDLGVVLFSAEVDKLKAIPRG